MQTWRPSHWSSWMFESDAAHYDAATGTFLFTLGGFQGARGDSTGEGACAQVVSHTHARLPAILFAAPQSLVLAADTTAPL